MGRFARSDQRPAANAKNTAAPRTSAKIFAALFSPKSGSTLRNHKSRNANNDASAIWINKRAIHILTAACRVTALCSPSVDCSVGAVFSPGIDIGLPKISTGLTMAITNIAIMISRCSDGTASFIVTNAPESAPIPGASANRPPRKPFWESGMVSPAHALKGASIMFRPICQSMMTAIIAAGLLA